MKNIAHKEGARGRKREARRRGSGGRGAHGAASEALVLGDQLRGDRNGGVNPSGRHGKVLKRVDLGPTLVHHQAPRRGGAGAVPGLGWVSAGPAYRAERGAELGVGGSAAGRCANGAIPPPQKRTVSMHADMPEEHGGRNTRPGKERNDRRADVGTGMSEKRGKKLDTAPFPNRIKPTSSLKMFM